MYLLDILGGHSTNQYLYIEYPSVCSSQVAAFQKVVALVLGLNVLQN